MDWIAENDAKGGFPKPVGNKELWKGEGNDFIVFAIGANARSDFHINPGDELFLQVKGDIRVDIMEEPGKRVINIVREGDTLLVPAFVPHAPRRPADTFGFVVERVRVPGELDVFAWFCEECDHKIHEISCRIEDIEQNVREQFDAFNNDEEARTCGNCGALMPVYDGFTLDDQRTASSRVR
jgi:3-hydroxyanthranilate 3,4-dioxygenase